MTNCSVFIILVVCGHHIMIDIGVQLQVILMRRLI